MILHIPHAATRMIPGIGIVNLEKSINLMTDWYADELFHHMNSSRVIADLSRLVVDVEKLPEDPMQRVGKGRIYSTDVNDVPIIRSPGVLEKCKEIYDFHHEYLNNAVSRWLSYFPVVVVVDCHTFNETPLPWETPGDRPDICIGTNSIHTPEGLPEALKEFFQNHGLSVEINFPYYGAIVPTKYKMRPDVFSIMIEVNKRLYINNSTFEREAGRFNDTRFICSRALEIVDEWEKNWESEFWKKL